MLNKDELLGLLVARGPAREEMFAQARVQRQRVFGARVVLRGVAEVTNVCRVNCQFCPMRRANTRDNTSFHLTTSDLVQIAAEMRSQGINVVFFQGGEIPQTTKTVGEALPKIREMFGDDVEILLNLGTKNRAELAYLREQGADSYILKHETSNPELNMAMRGETLDSRLRCIETLLELGYKVGTGAIVGLPGQTVDSLADDILLAHRMGVHMCSFSPFIPAPATPLQSHRPSGVVDLTLNAMAASRLANPKWLIPSVSALEATETHGQSRGFDAGANVMTVNFSPGANQGKYLIYGERRFIVQSDYARAVLAQLSLEPSPSVFIGRVRADSLVD